MATIGGVKRIAITGGAGFLGSALANRLVALGHEVVVIDDFSRGRHNRLGEGIECWGADVRDYDAIEDALRGCDAVAHLAMVQGTQVFTEDPWRTQDVAINGTMNVLRAMLEHDIRDLLLVSSSEAYQGERDKIPTDETVWLSVPDPLNPRFSYGGGKLAMEVMCAAFAQDNLDRLAIVRPHNVIGPDMGEEHVLPQFIRRMEHLAKGTKGVIPFPIQGSGLETRAFCYISDCTDALTLLLEHAPEGPSIWHVGTPDERTIRDVAHAVGVAFGRTVEVVPGELPKGSPPRRCPDITKLRGLGYAPKVGFDDAVRITVDWYRSHPA